MERFKYALARPYRLSKFSKSDIVCGENGTVVANCPGYRLIREDTAALLVAAGNSVDAAIALADAVEAATITTAIEFAHPDIVVLARKFLAVINTPDTEVESK
jgi:hypothetical protein